MIYIQYIICLTLGFITGMWCGIGWQKPWIDMARRAEAERDEMRDKTCELMDRIIKIFGANH